VPGGSEPNHAALAEDSLPASTAHATALLWIGSEGGMEQALVERQGLAYRGIRTGQLRGVNPLQALLNIRKMIGGVRRALAILDEFRPQVCLVTGGYVCAPVVVACRLRRIPVLIYLPDMTPGWAIRWLSTLAQRVAVTRPQAAAHFGGEWPQGKAIVTGYPVRAELVAAAQDRQAARQRLAAFLNGATTGSSPAWTRTNLDVDDAPLLLVWGASQGARSINRATWAALDALTPHAHILHIVGTRDWPMAQDPTENPAAAADAPKALVERYCAVDYLHEAMIDALAAADLTVSRAGASILGEFTVTGLPAVLVPLPIAGGHQDHNAQELAQAGAAVVIADSELQARSQPSRGMNNKSESHHAMSNKLVETVQPLLQDTQRRQRMAQAARAQARPDAADAIALELWKLANVQRKPLRLVHV
jgi:UDP-N-acetylglucosamine--N-acetylmuramyl-(pentapeptide) pyrophosphoryl-undecaprenol N-acetylglucosamine transferase